MKKYYIEEAKRQIDAHYETVMEEYAEYQKAHNHIGYGVNVCLLAEELNADYENPEWNFD